MFSLKPLIALSLAVCVASTGARDANTEFKIKFKKTNTQGTLNAKMPGDEALSPTDQLREWHRRSGTSGNNDGGGTPTEKDDEELTILHAFEYSLVSAGVDCWRGRYC